MMPCPKCKGRATKIVHASTDTIECQQCTHEYPIEEELERRKQRKKRKRT